MNELQFIGKITSVSEVKTGVSKTGKEYASVNFEMKESGVDYPQVALFSLYKDGEYKKQVEDFLKYNPIDSTRKVTFKMKKSEYKKQDGTESAFYSNSVWKLEKVDVANEAPEYPEEDVNPDDIPF